jgi:hypothetical protein
MLVMLLAQRSVVTQLICDNCYHEYLIILQWLSGTAPLMTIAPGVSGVVVSWSLKHSNKLSIYDYWESEII